MTIIKKYKQLYTYNEQLYTYNEKLTSSNWRRTLRGSLGSPHIVGQMGTKSKWDESQNVANRDENAK